jgi:DNA-binding IclR family transcriptional regulator
MTRHSPAVVRTVAVLNFFAQHPDQSFTATDVVKALRMSRATCHALMAALVDLGYLYRDGAKNHVLGPALASIGRIALEHFSPLLATRPEMRELADDFDAVCSAIFRDRNEIVVRERAAAASHIGWTTISQTPRSALVPPLGNVFMAWSSTQEIDTWLHGVSSDLNEQTQNELLASLEFVRSRRYTFGYRRVPIEDEKQAKELVGRRALTNYAVTELELGRVYELAYVVAPVFDAQGKVAFAISLTGFVKAVPGPEVERIGKRLRASCDRIGNLIAEKAGVRPGTAK